MAIIGSAYVLLWHNASVIGEFVENTLEPDRRVDNLETR